MASVFRHSGFQERSKLRQNFTWKVYLEGNVLIQLPGYRMESSDAFYSEERPKRTDVMLTAIPYYAWANRGENQMRVWMPEE